MTLSEYDLLRQGAYVPPVNSVLMTFDDSLKSIVTLVEPLLIKYDINATSFVIGDNINDEG